MVHRNCIIIKNDGIGDLILASGIIADISKHFDNNVSLVTCTNNREIAENIYGVKKVFFISRDDLKFNPYLGRIGIYLFPNITKADEIVLKQIESVEYNCAICLRRYIRANSFFVMSRIRAQRKYCMWQFPTNISRRLAFRLSSGWRHYYGDSEKRHEVSYYQEFGENELEISIDPRPRLRCFEEVKPVVEWMKIGVCIGGTKGNWPLENWIELLMMLQKEKFKICLFGGTDVVGYASRIEELCPGCINYVGRMGFIESIPILRTLCGFIGNETGYSHFASLILPKILIIYSGRTFCRFFPWPGSNNQYIIYYALNCFDCSGRCKYYLDRYRCLRLVKPGAVFRYFKAIICSEDVTHQLNLNP